MNNNYLILGLVLFFGVLYYCFSPSSVTENFQNQAVTSGQDDMNSINTLAQLARQLMSGGTTLPGNLTVQGNTTISGNTTVGGILTITGKTIAQNTFEASGDLVGYSHVWGGTGSNRVRLGETWGAPGIYGIGTSTGNNDKLNLMSSSGKVYVGAVDFGASKSTVSNDLIVTGNLNVKNMQVTPIVFSIGSAVGVVSTTNPITLTYYLQVNGITSGASCSITNTNNDPKQQWYFNGDFIMNVATNELLALDGDILKTIPPTRDNIKKHVKFFHSLRADKNVPSPGPGGHWINGGGDWGDTIYGGPAQLLNVFTNKFIGATAPSGISILNTLPTKVNPWQANYMWLIV